MMGSGENNSFISQLHHGNSSCQRQDVSISEQEGTSVMTEESSQGKQWRKPNLVLEIPTRTLEVSPQEVVQINMPPTPTPTPKKVNFLLTHSPSDSLLNAPYGNGPSSTRRVSSFRSILPKLRSFKNWGSNADADKSANVDNCPSNVVSQDKLSISRSWSFSKIFTPRIGRASSLPVPEPAYSNSNSNSAHGGSVNSHATVDMKEVGHIHRSISLPVINKEKNIQKVNSFFRVIPSTPRAKVEDLEVSMATEENDENNEANGEDIPEEEAVCRICLVELCEGGETLKMECSCKGELALAHQDCAVKWFAIKGNKTCEVCKQEVLNLPVTLLRVQSSLNRNAARNFRQMEFNGYRVWQELPILVIVGMLAYFCFLEQLLVKKLDTGAIAISLPFSCALGLLSSMTSSAMVKRRFVWVYATSQFILVVAFAHIFYNVIHVQPVISILLSTFAGFGLAMSGASIIVEVVRWRERHRSVTHQNEIRDEIQSTRSLAPPPSLITTPSLSSPGPRRDGVENPSTSSGS